MSAPSLKPDQPSRQYPSVPSRSERQAPSGEASWEIGTDHRRVGRADHRHRNRQRCEKTHRQVGPWIYLTTSS
jgi:hypothetical protein